MANGNTEVIREMRELLKQGKPLDIDTRDRLLFTAVIDIYEKLELLSPVLIFYKVSMWVTAIVAAGILGIIGGIATGKIELIFK